MELIQENLHHLRELCSKYKVKTLYVFGSILTDRFRGDSDVDFLVNFNSEIDYTNYTDNFFNLYYSLKELFKREIDLVDDTAVRNKYFRAQVDKSKYLIYG